MRFGYVLKDVDDDADDAALPIKNCELCRHTKVNHKREMRTCG